MNIRSRINTVLTFAAVALAAFIFTSASTYAADRYWDGTSSTGDADGGAGTWDTSTSNWDDAATGGSDVTWPDTTADKAFFGAAAGTVTLGSNITLGELEISSVTATGTYLIGSNTEVNTLSFGGANLITVTAENATFRAGISGAPDIDLSSMGSRTLTLNPAGSLTQDIGTITHTTNNGNFTIDLDGTTTGNSISDIDYQNIFPAHQLFLNKDGSGTWTVGGLSGSGSHDDRVDVNDGVLIANGTWTPSHEFSVNNGGTLGGTATIGPFDHNTTVTVFAGGAVAPGVGGIGTLTVSSENLTWNSDDSTAGMLFDLSTIDSTSDLLDITGTGDFLKGGTGSTFLFDFTGGTADGTTYTLVNFDTTDFSVGDFAVGSGIAGTFALNANNLQFTTIAIPEPSTAVLAALGLLGLVGIGRRRRR